MILGIDFLNRHKAKIEFVANMMVLKLNHKVVQERIISAMSATSANNES